MTNLSIEVLKMVFARLKTIMDNNRERLIELDSVMGDGDLGITMQKSFTAAYQESSAFQGKDLGKLLMQIGMKIAQAAPSTMGSLLARGFMKGGKSVFDKEILTLADLSVFFRAFTDAIMEAGKTKPGNKTIVDSVDGAAMALEEAASGDKSLVEGIETAYAAAKEGVEKTKQMKAQHGRAAYYQDKSIGVVDAGATVGLLIIEGFLAAVREQ